MGHLECLNLAADEPVTQSTGNLNADVTLVFKINPPSRLRFYFWKTLAESFEYIRYTASPNTKFC